MVSEDLRIVENEIDVHYKTMTLVRENTFGVAVIHYLRVCEEQQNAALLGIRGWADANLEVLADTIINRSKPALQWLMRDCRRVSSDNFNYDDRTFGFATNFADLAEQYLTFESAFVYATADLADLELQENRIVTSGAARNDSVYDAYDRIRDSENREPTTASGSDFVETLSSTLRIVKNSFTYTFSPKLVSQTLDSLGPSLNNRFSLPVDWQFPLFNLAQFRAVAKIIWTLAFIHLQARTIAIMKGCPFLGIENSVLLMTRETLIARVQRYSGVELHATAAIIDHLTFGEHGQNNPDPALQPVIQLDSETLALAPSIICNSSIERNLMVLINRIPDAQRMYSILNREREELMRRTLLGQIEGSELVAWYGVVSEWREDGEIDLVLVSHADRICLVIELKSFIAPAEPKEIINRSEEIARGVEQIRSRRDKFGDTPEPLLRRLGLVTGYDFCWAVVSENSIGGNYVQAQDVPIVNRRHLGNQISGYHSLRMVCEWLNNRWYLPVEGTDFEEFDREAKVGKFSVEWYAIQLLG